MNQANFEKLYVTEDNITDAKVHPPFDQLMEARKEYESPRRQPTRQDHPRSHGRPQQGSQSRHLADIPFGGGLSKTILVGAQYIELLGVVSPE
jgi:hypothetical protein